MRKAAVFILLLISSATFASAQSLSVSAVATGESHSVVLNTDGTVWMWGTVSGGQGGSLFDSPLPKKLNIEDAKRIAAGARHTLILKDDGTLWAVGRNDHGQLGNGSDDSSSEPVRVRIENLTVTAIAAGDDHSLALTCDNSLWSWGKNDYGQLGDGTTTDSPFPVRRGISAIAIGAGGNHTLAVKEDGTVWAWGDNAKGQLGAGSTIESPTPAQVDFAAEVKITAVAGGAAHSLALSSDGRVWAWGANSHGQLGNNGIEPQHAPVAVHNLTNIRTIAAGRAHSLAVSDDGTLWAWGANAKGQLGDGTISMRTSPVHLKELGQDTSVAAGNSHSLAVTATGGVWAWGRNRQGQLGDGTTEDHRLPIEVSEADFTWKVGTPIFSLTAGTYSSEQRVELSSATSGAVIRYTTNGHDPGTDDPEATDAGVLINRTITLKAKAWAGDMPASNVAGTRYVLAPESQMLESQTTISYPVPVSSTTHSAAQTASPTATSEREPKSDRRLVDDEPGPSPMSSYSRPESYRTPSNPENTEASPLMKSATSEARTSSAPASAESKAALLVVGSIILNTGDSAIMNRLENLGYAVTVQSASTTVSSDATGMKVVLISSTVPTGAIGTRFRDVTIPVITWATQIFKDMKMSGMTSGINRGPKPSQTQVVISVAGHPLAAGLTGTVTVAGSVTSLAYAVPSANAIEVATIVGSTTQMAIFGYETGAMMVGLTAPARRVGLFLTDSTAAVLTKAGWSLFDAAVNWASINTAPTIDAGPNQTIVRLASAKLDGTVSDDGLPNPPGALTHTWSKVSGPGAVTFGNVHAVDTTATFSAAGTYVLRLTSSDGALSKSDEISIMVNSGTLAASTINSAPAPRPKSGTRRTARNRKSDRRSTLVRSR